MSNYMVILNPDNSIGSIINLDTWGCFTNDPNNADYQIYEEAIASGYQPTYMGGDPTAANYPGPKTTTDTSTTTSTTTPAASSSTSTTTGVTT
jgi:hypothetical protein